jgi:hypothetical protein
MASTTEIWAAHSDALAKIQAQATAELLAVMRRLDGQPPEVRRDTMLQVMPALIAKWGNVAGVISAEAYDAARATDGIPATYKARVSKGFTDDEIEAQIRYRAGQFWHATPTGD